MMFFFVFVMILKKL